jgi:hypothetical protein
MASKWWPSFSRSPSHSIRPRFPTDPRVVIREIPPSLTAVARYSGRWSESSYDHHVAALRDALAADGLTAVSEPRLARFDPPFKPWFLRRNEVHIDVAEAV